MFTSVGLTLALLTTGCGGGAGQHTRPTSGPVPGTVFYHPDHLGSVAAQTDAKGAALGETSFDPYGSTLSPAGDPYAFTGKELDPTSGLYEFGARAYDPELGLFLSPDPAILADPELATSDSQLLNPYAYVRNSPTAYVDPDGRFLHILVGAGVGGAIGAGAYLIKSAVSGEFSAKGLVASTAGGVVGGAVAAATGGASLLVQGAAAGVAGGIVHRGIETRSISQTFDPQAIAVDAALGVAGGALVKGVGSVGAKIAPTVKAYTARAKGAVAQSARIVRDATIGVNTPWGRARQSLSPTALKLRRDAEAGATLYRGGTMGRSEAAEAQFWSFDHPSTRGFAAKQGLPGKNVKGADFVEAAAARSGAPLAVRRSPPVGKNPGGQWEAVVNPGDVQMKYFETRPPGTVFKK